MKKLNLVMSVLVIITLTLPFALAFQGSGVDGKELFTGQNCNMCHAVSAAGIEAKTKSDKMKGPDLAGFAPSDEAAMIAYLKGETEMNGAKHKKKFSGSDAELKALLAWLADQK